MAVKVSGAGSLGLECKSDSRRIIFGILKRSYSSEPVPSSSEAEADVPNLPAGKARRSRAGGA